MEVLKPGTGSNWSRKRVCTGRGGHRHGCGAQLRVTVPDLFMYGSEKREERLAHFECVQCKATTDIHVPEYIAKQVRHLPSGD